MQRRRFAGFDVVVENSSGTVRQWYDRASGESGETRMIYDYGFLEGYVGSDGDEVDCYLGPHEDAPLVYVIHQLASPDFKRHDEDKLMMGWNKPDAALAAYLAHRSDGDRAYGGMSAIPIERLRQKLERRTGTGKIRHGREGGGGSGGLVLMRIEQRGSKWVVLPESGDKVLGTHDTKEEAEKQLRAIEASKARAHAAILPQVSDSAYTAAQAMKTTRSNSARHGEAVAFDNGAGQVRTGVWDRICVPGRNFKDGEETVFDADTCAQMVENFARRGDPIMIDWNHQSSFAHENGQPAPALGFYGALAAVFGGQAVASASARGVAAQAPPIGMEDGLWGLRTEVTPQGHDLLPGFKLLSPTFTPDGTDQQGNPIGYQLLAVAATNTPWQAGTKISFQGETKMARSVGDEVRKENGHRGKIVEVRPDGTYVVEFPPIYVGAKPSREVLPEHKISFAREQTMAVTDINGVEIRRGDKVKIVTTGQVAEVVGDPSESKVDLFGPDLDPMAYAHPKKLLKMSAVGAKGEKTMNPKQLAAAKIVGLDATSNAKAVRAAYVARFEDEGKKSAMEEGYNYEESAKRLEDQARAYEDANFEEEEEEVPPHVIMRKMAAKFRHLAKLEEGKLEEDPPFGGKETPEEEAKEGHKMEGDDDEDKKMEAAKPQLQAMARRLGIDVRSGASSKQLFDAISAAAVPASQIGNMVKEQVTRALLERDKVAARATAKQRAEKLADAAVAGGYPAENRTALLSFAVSDYDGAVAMCRSFIGEGEPTAHLFSRMTEGGAPIGADPRNAATASGPDRRIVRNELATFVIEGERFSKMAQEWADAKEGAVKLEIDGMLGDHEREHPALRLYAANNLLKKKRPDLYASAEEII